MALKRKKRSGVFVRSASFLSKNKPFEFSFKGLVIYSVNLITGP